MALRLLIFFALEIRCVCWVVLLFHGSLFADLGLDVVVRPIVVQQSVDVVEFTVDELARGRT